MNNLSIELKKILPFVIDAFTKVYGEEYHDIISKKLNNAVIISYYDIEGLSDYILYIKSCKRREYGIKFLEKIGVDVKKYKKNNYIQPLDDEIEKKLEYYMTSSFFGFGKNTDFWVPLQAFKSKNETSSEILLQNKIKIINYILNNEKEQINEENFNLFVKTKEYHQILKKINEYNIVYEELLLEYSKWEKQLYPYEKFIEFEKERKLEILKKKKMTIFTDISSRLPFSVLNYISNKSLEEKSDAIFGSLDISSTSIIESFSADKMEKLKNKDVELFSKFLIIRSQVNYLKNIGIDITNENILKCHSEVDINNYLNFLNQENTQKYIPSDELINHITSIRKEKYEDALREYYVTRKDFVNLKNEFNNDEDSLKYIYERIKNKQICIPGGGATRSDNEFISIMFYTIRSNDGGKLFYNFMHECGHIIDQSLKGIGFESLDDFEGNIRNSYDNEFRKYEKFNETLNDIFTMEAIELLHNQGIYLIEPIEFTSLDTDNYNTALITKNLLQPLLSEFRQQVINAKVNGEREDLIRYIGKENFEELIDIINQIDYLSRNGIISKIDTLIEDDMVSMYFEQLERAKKTYANIAKYYKNNIENLTMIHYDQMKKNRKK